MMWVDRALKVEAMRKMRADYFGGWRPTSRPTAPNLDNPYWPTDYKRELVNRRKNRIALLTLIGGYTLLMFGIGAATQKGISWINTPRKS